MSLPYDLYIFDLDGTCYLGADPIPHAAESAQRVLKAGAQVRYLTNDSGSVPVRTAEKLRKLGFPAEGDWIFTSGIAAGEVCKCLGFSRVFVVGEEGLRVVLMDMGFEVDDQSPQALVVGICRKLTYADLVQGMDLVMAGAVLVGTNGDATFPSENGRLRPGAGTMVAAFEKCTGKKAVMAGKPEPTILQAVMRSAGVGPDRTLVIGDRIDSDILCAKNAGCDSYLVLTGIERELPEGMLGGVDLRGLPGLFV